MKQRPVDALDFHTSIAIEFDQSYSYDSNRLERLKIWKAYLAKYASGADLAYDLGCGSGAITSLLAQYAKRVIAIDGAEGMLAVARKNAAACGLSDRIEFRQSRLPIPGQVTLPQADVVISSSAIEYMDSVPDALAFARSLLKKQGTLIFSMSNRASISRKLVRAVHGVTGRPEYIKYLQHFVTLADLEQYLEVGGFTPVEFSYFGGADRFNRFLAPLLSPSRANNMILIAARPRE
jgi:ubiquinone/menaquinone biosynthesis C-methylase UbiE